MHTRRLRSSTQTPGALATPEARVKPPGCVNADTILEDARRVFDLDPNAEDEPEV
jgi:hypothetical protein